MEIKTYKDWMFTGSHIHNLPESGLYHNTQTRFTQFKLTPFMDKTNRDVYVQYPMLFTPEPEMTVHHPILDMFFSWDGSEWRLLDEV